MEYFEKVTYNLEVYRPQHLTQVSNSTPSFSTQKEHSILKTWCVFHFMKKKKKKHKTHCISHGLIREAEPLGLYISMCTWICYRDLTCNDSCGNNLLNSLCETIVFATNAKTKWPGWAVGKGRWEWSRGQAEGHKRKLKPTAVLLPLTLVVWVSCISWCSLSWAKYTHSAWELKKLKTDPGKVEQLQAQLLPHCNKVNR